MTAYDDERDRERGWGRWRITACILFVALPAAGCAVLASGSEDVWEAKVAHENQQPANEGPPQAKGPPAPNEPKPPLATDNDALALAALDLSLLPLESRSYMRYVYITDHDRETMQAMSLVINTMSRASLIVQPVPIMRGRLILLRVDVRTYIRNDVDLREWTKTWEEFRFDPRFNLLLTKDTLKFQGIKLPGKSKRQVTKKKWEQQAVPEFLHTDGKRYNAKWVEVDVVEVVEVDEATEDVLRIISPHLAQGPLVFLIDGTGSQAPVVSHGYFLMRALTAIQDDGVFQTLFSGLYYQLAGIKSGQKGATDEDVLFEQLGIGNTKAGITAAKIFDDLRSDERTAVFRSGVTGRPRRVDLLRSLAARVSTSQSILSVTHDLKRKSIDIAQNPLMNLIDIKADAKEVIFEKANSLLGYVLFDGKGKLQLQAPDDVVSDLSVPAPHQTNLQPAISCIRCHASEGGWRVLSNDVRRFVGIGKGDIIDDFNNLTKGTADVLDRLAGLYSDDPEKRLMPRARDDLANAVLRATGPWRESKNQLDVVKLSSDKIAAIFREYWYDLVTPQTVLHDLGIETDGKEDAAVVLKRLVPSVVPVPPFEFAPEDARILALLHGVGINRADYALVYSSIATRAAATLQKQVAK